MQLSEISPSNNQNLVAIELNPGTSWNSPNLLNARRSVSGDLITSAKVLLGPNDAWLDVLGVWS
jgi:hypothetical protein